MDLNYEIKNCAQGIIDALGETDFFKVNVFVEPDVLQECLIKKMKEKESAELFDSEFSDAVNEAHQIGVNQTLEDLLDKGLVNMSIMPNGEIGYKADPNLEL